MNRTYTKLLATLTVLTVAVPLAAQGLPASTAKVPADNEITPELQAAAQKALQWLASKQHVCGLPINCRSRHEIPDS